MPHPVSFVTSQRATFTFSHPPAVIPFVRICPMEPLDAPLPPPLPPLLFLLPSSTSSSLFPSRPLLPPTHVAAAVFKAACLALCFQPPANKRGLQGFRPPRNQTTEGLSPVWARPRPATDTVHDTPLLKHQIGLAANIPCIASVFCSFSPSALLTLSDLEVLSYFADETF